MLEEILKRMDAIEVRLKTLEDKEAPEDEDDEPEWGLYTCINCQETECEYMYDDYNMNGQCKKTDQED